MLQPGVLAGWAHGGYPASDRIRAWPGRDRWRKSEWPGPGAAGAGRGRGLLAGGGFRLPGTAPRGGGGGGWLRGWGPGRAGPAALGGGAGLRELWLAYPAPDGAGHGGRTTQF